MSSTILVNGQLTKDVMLDRTIRFDERSLNYPIMEVIEEKKPRSYTWGLPVVLDQGLEGACVGFAWAHELAGRPKTIKSINNEIARSIYKQAQGLDSWEGESYEGTSVIAGAKAVKERGSIEEYRWAFSLDDAIMTIGYKGPAVFGTNWYSNMYNTDMDGFIHATGRWRGGHAIVIRGVNIKKEYFILTNSWGSDWGKQGNCKLSFRDFDKLLNEQGELCIPLGRSLKI